MLDRDVSDYTGVGLGSAVLQILFLQILLMEVTSVIRARSACILIESNGTDYSNGV